MRQMKVMIVEDEPIVARYIKKNLDECGGFEVTAICENGEDAVALCQKETPHLLITDVKMPGLSGLEMIRMLRQQGRNMQVVIVSAYKDFAFAKEAISLGVEDYITKPINPDELKKTLLRLQDSCWKTLSAQKNAEMEQAMRDQNEAYLKSQFPYTHCSMLLVYQSGDIEELSDVLTYDEHSISFFYRNSMMLLMDRGYQAWKRIEAVILQIVSCMQARKTCAILVIWDVDITKDCFTTFRKLYRSVREIATPGKQTIHKYNVVGEIVPLEAYHDEALLKRMENKITAKEWRSLPEMLRELFSFWEKEQYDVYHIKMCIHQLTDQLQKTNALEHNKLVINEYLDDCIRFADSYDKMRDMVCGYLEKVLKNRNDTWQEGKNADQICTEIRQYVLQNESKSFSLNEICYLFKVSQPFIRKAFRMNTGMSYNEWVLDTKIERAKELMRANPRLLVKDVAAQLGYEQLYFSTVFNKHVGMSPSEFKFRLQEDSEEGNGQ